MDDTFVFDDSYILGWLRESNEVRLFVEVRVLPGSPYFRPFDKRKDAGRYLVGTLVFRGVSDVAGLPSDRHLVRRGRGEFEDVAEIEVFQLEAGTLRIEAEALQLRWRFASVEFEPGIQG